MHLYIVRHTQVDVPKGICYGKTDVGLASTFNSETEKVAQNFDGIVFDHVFSSPLFRCKKLSNALKETLKLPEISIDDRLIELNFGDWETKLWSDIEQTEYAKEWFNDFVNIPCPNGESYMQLIERTRSFINDLKKFKSGTNILIVTHGGIVRAMNLVINKIDPKNAFDLEVDYGQVIKLFI